MPTVIEATYQVTTPMFCGGANPADAELRLPSFKGVLRFWWRALAWPRRNGDLEAIKHEEDELFGSADMGQSRVSMRLTDYVKPQIQAGNSLRAGPGAKYLGYGVMEQGPRERHCLEAPFDFFDFTVRMRARDLDEARRNSLLDAMTALGVFGGMGAKSRKGYGSLALQSLKVDDVEQWQALRSALELHDQIVKLRVNDAPGGLPKYTALTKGARHVLLTAGKIDPIELLNRVGSEMVRYRSWGHNGRVLGSPSEGNFKDDHDLMKAQSHTRRSHPRRIAFGLPHNYGGGSGKQVGPHDRNLDRRASPLFIHVHQCGETPVAVLSFLPARFLPEGRSDINVGGSKIGQATEKELYQPIHDFLDRLIEPNRRKERFAQTLEVRL